MPPKIRNTIIKGVRVPIYKKKKVIHEYNQSTVCGTPRNFKGTRIIQEKFNRSCLFCSYTFEAEGRYTRICSSCKNKEEFKCPELGM